MLETKLFNSTLNESVYDSNLNKSNLNQSFATVNQSVNQSLNESTIMSNGAADKPEEGSLTANFRNKMQVHTNVKRIENFNMNDEQVEQPKVEQSKTDNNVKTPIVNGNGNHTENKIENKPEKSSKDDDVFRTSFKSLTRARRIEEIKKLEEEEKYAEVFTMLYDLQKEMKDSNSAIMSKLTMVVIFLILNITLTIAMPLIKV